ncbi:hypothetical protein Barb4_00171 [Bacteroidales bacterium Barb4]|nr:hypothetical protein Barb4_00171 [Bacteroidales bacterium Barb4]
MNCIKLSFEEREATLLESKLFGYPYIPVGVAFPTTESGKELVFLAQFNLAELPALDYLPKQGMLQFFIFDDEDYGEDESYFATNTARIIYWPTIDNNAQVDKPLRNYNSDYLIGNKCVTIKGLLCQDNEKNPISTSKIGGYADFIQNDFRIGDLNRFRLLFQLSSSRYLNWGDGGNGYFFTDKDSIFTSNLFHWDCF